MPMQLFDLFRSIFPMCVVEEMCEKKKHACAAAQVPQEGGTQGAQGNNSSVLGMRPGENGVYVHLSQMCEERQIDTDSLVHANPIGDGGAMHAKLVGDDQIGDGEDIHAKLIGEYQLGDGGGIHAIREYDQVAMSEFLDGADLWSYHITSMPSTKKRKNTPSIQTEADFGDCGETTTYNFLDNDSYFGTSDLTPMQKTSKFKHTPSTQTSVEDLPDITKLPELEMFPDISNHHGSDGLKYIYDCLRGSLDILDDDEPVMNSYSSILTGVDEMSAAGVGSGRPHVICDLCGIRFHARGMPMHRMACAKKQRLAPPPPSGNFSQTHA